MPRAAGGVSRKGEKASFRSLCFVPLAASSPAAAVAQQTEAWSSGSFPLARSLNARPRSSVPPRCPQVLSCPQSPFLSARCAPPALTLPSTPALNPPHPPISALQTAVGRGPGLALGLCPFCSCRCACHVYSSTSGGRRPESADKERQTSRWLLRGGPLCVASRCDDQGRAQGLGLVFCRQTQLAGPQMPPVEA